MKFQSTHSRGVRPGFQTNICNATCISIHALTRSATGNRSGVYYNNGISIHALTRSATIVDTSLYYASNKFQSTHSRGVRHLPTSHQLNCQQISIHALTRSATVADSETFADAVFQSTHSRGVRHSSVNFPNIFDSISIHALTRSATVLLMLYIVCLCDFNPRTHEECDKTASRTDL